LDKANKKISIYNLKGNTLISVIIKKLFILNIQQEKVIILTPEEQYIILRQGIRYMINKSKKKEKTQGVQIGMRLP